MSAREEPLGPEALAALRHHTVLETAEREGLLSGASGRIGARIPRTLLDAAKQRSGIKSDTGLLEYALAKVALEDDFGARLVALKGTVGSDLDLEF